MSILILQPPLLTKPDIIQLAEVTIEDVVSDDDINIFRNLSGGVTSIQILHGSANPIGGRSAVLKLKWGETADKLIKSEC